MSPTVLWAHGESQHAAVKSPVIQKLLLLLLLLKAPDGPGDGARLEGAEAGRRAVPGGAARLHRPH